MKYDKKVWMERIRSRSDISGYITHLTRETDEMSSVDVLMKILKDKKLIGSNKDGYIRGKSQAVCFQDSPLHGVAQNINHEILNNEKLGGKIRYRATGLLFHKAYVYYRGGRPVIYDNEDYFNTMPEDQQWRFVSYNLSDPRNVIDWTHEREWRIKGDFSFVYSEVQVILPGPKSYRKFIKEIDRDILESLGGIITLGSVIS